MQQPNLEVASAEPRVASSLDDLQEHRRAVHQGLCEELQQIPAIVKVNKDVEPLNGLQVLRNPHGALPQRRRAITKACMHT